MKVLSIIYALVIVAFLVGEVKCFFKMIDCNWEPVGKAEVIYTASTFTGLGCIVGYIDIKDK
tara:strand:+ start:940 stop:1125 length:186 start_codon:yes stop_codon:yes gene_type:complete